MNKTTIRFLGTGTSQGVPTIGCKHPVCLSKNPKDKRLRSSICINYKEKNYIIDCGPDFRQQLIRAQISSVSGIFFTHEHNDHTLGLDDIRPLVFLQKKDMDIFLDQRTLDSLKGRFPYVFDSENQIPGIPRVNPHLIKNLEPFWFEELLIEPIQVIHGKLPILAYKIGKMAYITDASYIPESQIEKLKDLDVLIINALRQERDHHSHFLLFESLQIIDELKPKKAYITHMSHEMGFHDEVENQLPKNVHLAYDGLILNL